VGWCLALSAVDRLFQASKAVLGRFRPSLKGLADSDARVAPAERAACRGWRACYCESWTGWAGGAGRAVMERGRRWAPNGFISAEAPKHHRIFSVCHEEWEVPRHRLYHWERPWSRAAPSPTRRRPPTSPPRAGGAWCLQAPPALPSVLLPHHPTPISPPRPPIPATVNLTTAKTGP